LNSNKNTSFHLTLDVGSGRETKHLKVSSGLAKAYKLVSKVVLLGFVFFWVQLASHGYSNFTHYIENSKNQFIQSKLDENSEKLATQEEEIDIYRNLHKHLSTRYGLASPADAEYQIGVGGPLNQDSLIKRLTHPGLLKQTQFEQTIERVNNKLQLNEEMYTDMQAHLETRLNHWRFIPSIKPASGYLSSGFGSRIHPVTGHRLKHSGLDIANAPWTPVMSTADGVVEKVTRGPHLGIYVKINHNNGYQTLYGHLNQATVKVGQFVNRYDQIGYMGSTGRSTGNHVHYEVRLQGNHLNPISFVLPTDHIVD
jgi:murein DD-endopeptidase MepM/ murein hydrolase activator NlpD